MSSLTVSFFFSLTDCFLRSLCSIYPSIRSNEPGRSLVFWVIQCTRTRSNELFVHWPARRHISRIKSNVGIYTYTIMTRTLSGGTRVLS
ncbi:hypothetical protein F5878DRAFT_254895 [Lentinula raphanica]|uniref:Secreted protein n=1 Tax=Lentinula raphanica TaxID=153919 RepID=A0AA38UC28_9AGAR|nr:hypothetical protein F5878DRAFT_254895 [Lentinula raphanica]